jgi:hypothetical protein
MNVEDVARLYPHVTSYLSPPAPSIWEVGPKPIFEEDGTVWEGKERVGFWYALIGPTRNTLVRRDKLQDIERIERARWRVLTRMQEVVHARWKKALDKANELGRIWYEDEFRYAHDDETPRARRDEEEPTEAIERLSLIPSPEEELAGAEYKASEQWRESYWGRLNKINAILRCAMSLHREAPKVDQYGGMRTRAVNVTFKLNGRLYINYTPHGWGQDTVQIWPTPQDDTHVLPSVKEKFRNCLVCGVVHNRKVRNCLNCPPAPTPKRATHMRRGGLLRDDRHRRRRLGTKLD